MTIDIINPKVLFDTVENGVGSVVYKTATKTLGEATNPLNKYGGLINTRQLYKGVLGAILGNSGQPFPLQRAPINPIRGPQTFPKGRAPGYVPTPANFPKSSSKMLSFVAEIKDRGVAKQASYFVEFVPPPFLEVSHDITKLIGLFCEQAVFPEMAFATSMIKDAGLNREVVYDKLYGNMTLTFILDQNMLIKDFFDAWMHGVVANTRGIFEYPKSYTSAYFLIHQVDAQRNIVYTNRMLRVTPKVLNDQITNAQSRDYQRLQVMFSFENWEYETKAMKGSVAKTRDDPARAGEIILTSSPTVDDPSFLEYYQNVFDMPNIDGGYSDEIIDIPIDPTPEEPIPEP